jgi:hypothetical protein
MLKSKKLIVIILSTIFLSSCGPKSVTKVDGEAVASLMSYFHLCRALAKEDKDADCTFINLEDYGVVEKRGIKLDPNINIQVAIVNHKLSAFASHVEGKEVFHLDSTGKIAPLTN